MPNFKPKPQKKLKYVKKTKVTLDNKHTEMMTEFKNIKTNVIPDLKKDLQKLQQQLKDTKEHHIKSELQLKIKEIQKKIKKKKKKEKKYLLENSKYIFNYFEKKKELSLGNNIGKKKILHNFFNKNNNVKIDKIYY